MSATYEILIASPTGTLLGALDRFARCAYARQVNGVGSLDLVLPDIYDRGLFQLDGRIYVQRSVAGGPPYVDMDAAWLIRDRYESLGPAGEQLYVLECDDAVSLLAGPHVAYNTGSTGTPGALKLDAADDFAKQLVRENMGALASDTTRDLSAYLTVQADLGQGATLRRDFSRRVLLDAVQELATASAEYGTYIAFDVVVADPLTGALEFRTYATQRGVDHRFPDGNPPVLLDPDAGSLADVELRLARRDERAYVYAGGQGVGSIRAVSTASSAARIAESPFQRSRELFVDAGNAADATELAAAAAQGLRDSRPRIVFAGRLVETPDALRGVHWDFGDYLTANYRDQSYDVRVDQVAVTLQPTQDGISEQVEAGLLADFPGSLE